MLNKLHHAHDGRASWIELAAPEGASATPTWNSEAHFELAWQEEVAIQGLRGVLKVGAKAVESPVCCHLGILQNRMPMSILPCDPG